MSIQEKNPSEGVPTEAPADIKSEAPATPEKPKRKRGRRLALMFLVPVLLVGVGGYVWITGGRYEDTENANLLFSKIAIASEITGRVTESNVANNKHVHKGDVLFSVDPEPLKIALDQANAAIETARLNVAQLRTAYQQALVQQQAAENDVAYAQDTLKRYKTLSNKGVATTSSYDDALHDAKKADDQLASAKEAVANARAAAGPALEGEIDDHPNVIAAKAAADKAAYDLKVATVHAPADGMLYEASDFRPGRYVAAGTALFTLVAMAGNTDIEMFRGLLAWRNGEKNFFDDYSVFWRLGSDQDTIDFTGWKQQWEPAGSRNAMVAWQTPRVSGDDQAWDRLGLADFRLADEVAPENRPIATDGTDAGANLGLLPEVLRVVVVPLPD